MTRQAPNYFSYQAQRLAPRRAPEPSRPATAQELRNEQIQVTEGKAGDTFIGLLRRAWHKGVAP